MSWAQLYEHIKTMNHEERLQPVRIADEGDPSRAFEVNFVRAEADIIERNTEGHVILRKGEAFLA